MNPVQPVTPEEAALLKEKSLEHGYFVRCLIVIDICINVILLRGRLGETISAHSARAALLNKKWGIIMCKFLNLFAKNHGAGAIIGDEVRAEAIDKTEEEANIIK